MTSPQDENRPSLKEHEQQGVQILVGTGIIAFIIFILVNFTVLYLIVTNEDGVVSLFTLYKMDGVVKYISTNLQNEAFLGIFISLIVAYGSILFYAAKMKFSASGEAIQNDAFLSIAESMLSMITFVLPIVVSIYAKLAFGIPIILAYIAYIFLDIILSIIGSMTKAFENIEKKKELLHAILVLGLFVFVAVFYELPLLNSEPLKELALFIFVLATLKITHSIVGKYIKYTESYKVASALSMRTKNIVEWLIFIMINAVTKNSVLYMNGLVLAFAFLGYIAIIHNFSIIAFIYLVLSLPILLLLLSILHIVPKGYYDIYLTTRKTPIKKAVIIEENYRKGYIIVLTEKDPGQRRVFVSSIESIAAVPLSEDTPDKQFMKYITNAFDKLKKKREKKSG